METMKLRSHIGDDGILQIHTPTNFKDTSVEVVLVLQPLSDNPTTTENHNITPGENPRRKHQ